MRLAATLLTLLPLGVLGVAVVLVRRAHPELPAAVWLGTFDLGNWLLLPGAVVGVLTRKLLPAALLWGLTFTLWAVLVHNPVGDLALWVGLVFSSGPGQRLAGSPITVA